MILDSSAVVAILRDEPERDAFLVAIATAASVSVSTATVLECAIVLGPTRSGDLDELLDAAEATIVPVDGVHLRLARQAHERVGRGSGSPARLNFGDCFSYALARSTGEPLLCKGDDFRHTDLTLAR